MTTFGFFAPSGFVADAAVVDRAEARLVAAGHRVKRDPALLACDQRFAGCDDDRLAAFERMATDPDIEVAVALRGGYGISRLLDRIDYARLASGEKRWVGHSDFTAFQLALLASTGQGSIQGPMIAPDFGVEVASQFTLDRFLGLLGTGCGSVRVSQPQTWQGERRGRLWGGNLAMVCHLLATPWWPQGVDGILFLEDVAEPPFRIDRLLHQLDFAGVLRRQSALLLGDFSGYRLGAPDNGFDLDTVTDYWRQRLGIPVLSGLPFGHLADKLSLPLGGTAHVMADADGWQLDYSLAPLGS